MFSRNDLNAAFKDFVVSCLSLANTYVIFFFCIILYLQLSDLRGDVPHQVLTQKIQAVWTDELPQRLQLCPQGDMNNLRMLIEGEIKDRQKLIDVVMSRKSF